jgi:hypothetical protein
MTDVFISYAHDGPAQMKRVADLARRLRGDGLQVTIDQDIGPSGPANGWEIWSQHRCEDAHRVLVVCTRSYRERFDGRAPPGSGQGAVFEGVVIRKYLRENRQANLRVRAVLLDDADRAHIPAALDEYHWFPAHTAAGYAKLLAWLREAAAAPAAPARPPYTPGYLVALRWAVAWAAPGKRLRLQPQLLPLGDDPDDPLAKITPADWAVLKEDDVIAARHAVAAARAQKPVRIPGVFPLLAAPPPSGSQAAMDEFAAQVIDVSTCVSFPVSFEAGGGRIDCLPAQLRSLPESLRGSAMQLLVHEQQRRAEAKGATHSATLPFLAFPPIFAIDDPERYPHELTRTMLAAAADRAAQASGGLLRFATPAARIARELGFGIL